MKKIKKDTNKPQSRPPIVVVLGHVDHGKSSLLEAIKDFRITTKESGGITQHIGAYQVEHEGKKITFIDTPGHEAFEAIRSRGAKIADIAILVIAGEEGIKPQTKEAIAHIKEAELPMIVAINKIDKPAADPERVKRELMSQNIVVEALGGQVPSVNTSATTKKGIPELLEMILLVAEMENLKGDISKPVEGVVVESRMDGQRGPTATLIIQNGILKEGMIIGTKSGIAKIKTMQDFQGKPIKEALPSDAVIVLGFETVPTVGDTFKAYFDTEAAKKDIDNTKKIIFKAPKIEEGINLLNVVLKTDVVSSVEAIANVLNNIPQEKASINVVRAETGNISESDVKLAKSSNSIIFGFRVKASPVAQKLALKEKVRIITFDIIYELAQTVRDALEKKLDPEFIKKEIGKIKILAIFKVEKGRQIIGGKVISGEGKRGVKVNVLRDEEEVGNGRIVKLQKDKVDEDAVAKGRECGILFEGNVDVKENDILFEYLEEKQKSTL
jgi:translation initiation factor IF-2